MKVSKRIVLALFATCGMAGAYASPTDYVPGEVLIKFRQESTLYARAAATWLSAEIKREIPVLGVRTFRLPGWISVERAIELYRRLPTVEYVEPNYRVHATFTPNDPLFGQQWHLQTIHCPAAWDFQMGSSSVIIAMPDTGVDLDHPDLVDKLVPGYDIENNDSVPEDDHGHGTHTAGIAAASTDNGIAVAGVGINCRIMPIKVLDASGDGNTSQLAAGMVYAIEHGATIISMSLGASSGSTTLSNAVQNAKNHGILMVAAAGNNGAQTQFYPAAYPDVIAVGATSATDNRSGFSNFGFWVDVAAPGEAILSTAKGGGTIKLNGTSMAAPQVAGLAGLLWTELGSAANPTTVRARIEDNCIPVGSWVAHGRIDAERAVRNLGNPQPVRQDFPPTAITVDYGSPFSGDIDSLAASDDVRLEILPVRSGGGKRLQYWASAKPTWTGQKSAIEVSVEANLSPGGSLRVALYNWTTLAWDVIGTKLYGGADRTYTVSTSTPAPYIAGNGEVRAQLYKFDDRNRPFRVRVDRLTITSVSAS